MEPIKTAGQTIPMIERGGVIAVVIICAVVVVFGVVSALIIVWRSREIAIATIQKIQEAHYQVMLQEIARKTELEHKLSDNLANHVAAIQSLRETLAGICYRVGHAQDNR